MDTEIDLLQRWEAAWRIMGPLGVPESEMTRFLQHLWIIGPPHLQNVPEILDTTPVTISDLTNFRAEIYDPPSDVSLAEVLGALWKDPRRR
eukprot:5182063-Alexandrium_andersonii.AAC.1